MLRKVKNLMLHRGRKSDRAAAERAIARAEAQRHLRDARGGRGGRTQQDAPGYGFHAGGGAGFDGF